MPVLILLEAVKSMRGNFLVLPHIYKHIHSDCTLTTILWQPDDAWLSLALSRCCTGGLSACSADEKATHASPNGPSRVSGSLFCQ